MTEEDRMSYDDENYESIDNEETATRDDNLTPASVANALVMTPMLEQAEEGDYPHKDVELRFERFLYNTQNPDSPICEECGAKLWGRGDLTGQELECLFCGEKFLPIKERKEK